MPVFTQLYIDSLEPGAGWKADSGGKNCVTGLMVYSGARSKTYYVQVKRDEKVKIGRADTYTVKKARTEAKRKLGKSAEGHDFKAARHQKKVQKANTLKSYLDGPFKEHAEASIAGHRQMLAGLKKNFSFLMPKSMTEITELDLAKWRRKRSDVSLATQRRELTNLKSVLNHAVKNKAIPGHQVAYYRVKGTLTDIEITRKVRYLTGAEEMRLRASLDAREARQRQERASGNRWRAERGHAMHPEIGPLQFADHIKPIILLALNTGLRRGDLFGLKWEHIDLGRRQISKVIEKTSHSQRKAGRKPEAALLPLSAEAHAILTQCEKQKHPTSQYVFTSPRSGGRLDNISKAFHGVISAAKIEDFRFHDLRHTFASRLVMAGVDINTVRELMAHSEIKMTLVYAHLSPDHKAAALDRAFGGVP